MSSLWASKPAEMSIKSGLKASDASKICWKPRRNSAGPDPRFRGTFNAGVVDAVAVAALCDGGMDAEAAHTQLADELDSKEIERWVTDEDSKRVATNGRAVAFSLIFG